MSNITGNFESERENRIMKHNLRDAVKNLTKEYNRENDIYNNQQKVLNKYDFYLSLQNKKLNQQLNELRDIENIVATRDSLVRGNIHAFKEKQNKIHAIKVFFSMLLFFTITLVSYLGGKITLWTFMGSMISLIIVYMIYLIWYFNLFYTKSITKVMKKDVGKIGQDIYEEGRKMENNLNQFINGQCDCPLKNGDPKGQKLPHKRFSNPNIPNNNGFFYYDNTSPVQRIYPNVTKKDSTENKFQIDWNSGPDMGQRSTGRYTPMPVWRPGTQPGDFGLAKGKVASLSETCPNEMKTKIDYGNFWAVDL